MKWYRYFMEIVALSNAVFALIQFAAGKMETAQVSLLLAIYFQMLADNARR